MIEKIETTAHECLCGGIVSIAVDIDNDFVECNHCNRGYPIDYWPDEGNAIEFNEFIENRLKNAN